MLAFDPFSRVEKPQRNHILVGNRVKLKLLQFTTARFRVWFSLKERKMR